MKDAHIEKKDRITPGFLFLSLGVFATLITVVIAFLNLVFEALNKQFPDVLNATYQYGYASWNYEGMRVAIATLIIVLPVFMVLSYLWNRKTKEVLGSIDTAIQKWMVYIILFLVGIIVVVDLVTLVNFFVSGEITTRFILKVLVVLITAGIVGTYYILSLGVWKKYRNVLVKSLAVGGPLLVLLAIILSFGIIGSPKDQRTWRLDEKRTADLQSIQWQVISYWQQKETLPESLTDLASPLSGYMVPVDPEFEKGVSYRYVKKGDMTFELCATFGADMQQGWQEYSGGGGIMPYAERDMAVSSMPYPGGTGSDSWDHGVGDTCFERTIDADMYPPYTKGL